MRSKYCKQLDEQINVNDKLTTPHTLQIVVDKRTYSVRLDPKRITYYFEIKNVLIHWYSFTLVLCLSLKIFLLKNRSNFKNCKIVIFRIVRHLKSCSNF